MSAKQGLLKWLCAFVAFDILVIGALLTPQLLSVPGVGARGTGALTAFLAPPVLLLLNTLVPQDIKHILVFWRFRDVLPAHRAFSKYVHGDPRIDGAALEARIGAFPSDPRDQQNLWYRLYQRHKLDVSVVDAHRPFLVFRYLAALSFLLAIFLPATLWGFGYYVATWSTLAVFAGQFLLAVAASRQAAKRFVCTVLSLESHAPLPPKP